MKQLSALCAGLVVFLCGFRLAALLYYGDSQLYSNFKADLLQALWLGLRFDLSVVSYLVIPVIIGLIIVALSARQNWFSRFPPFARYYLWGATLLVGFIQSMDFFYYAYFRDHLNILVFGFFADDTLALIKLFWRNYPVIPFFLALFSGGWIYTKILAKLIPETPLASEFNNKRPFPWWGRGLIYLLLVFLPAIAARGSFGLFPLGPADTVISNNAFVNYLPMNGIHSLARAIKLKKNQNQWDTNLKYYGYTDIRSAFAAQFDLRLEEIPSDPLQLIAHKTNKNIWAEKTKPHIVVLMMESFGTYWQQFNSQKFDILGSLQNHFQKDYLFKNTLPSTGSTVGSVSSLLIGAPQRPDGPFLTESEFLQVSFRTSPAKIFKAAGYETRFVYGGNPGWRDLNKFASIQGFDHVEGEIDVANKLGKLAETHDWGIYDADLLKYIETILLEAKSPQLIVALTTTNHPPYQLPSNFNPPHQEVPAELSARLIGDTKIVASRFKVYLYSAESLSQFITNIKSSDLANRTLISATGDHNFWLVNFGQEEQLAKWGVPIYFYLPDAIRPEVFDPQTFGSHMDIFPSLYALALSNADYAGFGKNLFDDSQDHYAFYSDRLALGKAGATYALKGKENYYFDWDSKQHNFVKGKESPSGIRMSTKYKSLMSILDYYFHSEKELQKNGNTK